MACCANLIILLTTVLFLAVIAKAAAINDFFPNNPYYPYIPQNPPQESTEHPAVYKEIVFGQDIEGAKILSNYEYNYSYSSNLSEISSHYTYPFRGFNNVSEKITKILILIEKSNNEMSFNGTITKGGVGQKNVSLQILVKDTHKLHYKVTIYGIEGS